MKNGAELLKFAIKEHYLELVEDIYKKCMFYFKQDLRNNKIFLSIITSTSQILNEYYPEYISRYSSETSMIIDSPLYNIEHQSNDLHLHSFSQNPQLINLTRSILWTKYHILMSKLFEKSTIMFMIIIYFQKFIIILFLPIYLFIYYILSKYHFINDIYIFDQFSYFYYYTIRENLTSKFSKPTAPTITFMSPYIKFINYPEEYNYNWFWELIMPKPSPFTKTISSDVYDIYKTWNGKALINFKWRKYGIYYHLAYWFGFITLLVCFNIAAKITQDEYVDIRKKLLISSTILGFFYLNFEVRQFIYSPIKWIRDIGNIFGM